jgi:hypothetical protein
MKAEYLESAEFETELEEVVKIIIRRYRPRINYRLKSKNQKWRKHGNQLAR